MDNFYKEVAEIENEAKSFIDESFQSLRSAEGAFDMLLNFKHLRSREAINNQMMQKFRDILVQYGKEVGYDSCSTCHFFKNFFLYNHFSPVFVYFVFVLWEFNLFDWLMQKQSNFFFYHSEFLRPLNYLFLFLSYVFHIRVSCAVLLLMLIFNIPVEVYHHHHSH